MSLWEGEPTTAELEANYRATLGAVGSVVSQALNTFDLVSELKFIEDINNIVSVANTWRQAAGGYRSILTREAAFFRNYGVNAIGEIALSTAITFPDVLAERAKSIGMTGKIWPATASVLGQRYRIEDAIYARDDWFTAGTAIRNQYMIATKAHRYWKKYFAPNIPSSKNTFHMWKKGICTKTDVETALQELDGLSSEWTAKVISHMDYDPSIRDIIRVAQATTAPPSWIRKKVKAMGMNQEDEDYFVEMISFQTISSERNSLITALVSDRIWGSTSESYFKNKLSELRLKMEEIDFLVALTNTKKSSNLLSMQRDTQVYLYRKDQFNADELYRRLWEDVLIETDVANAITSLEAAKKGIEWTAPP